MRWNTLADLINRLDLRVGAEVGTRDGDNIRHLLQLCPRIEHIAAVDWFERGTERVASIDPRVSTHAGTSWEVADTFGDATFDWIFIDAGHDRDSVSRDIEAYRRKVRGGGWMTGHDYASEKYPGVTKGVHDHFRAVIAEKWNPDRSAIWMIRM